MQVDQRHFIFTDEKRAFCLEKGVTVLDAVIPVTFRGNAGIKGFFCGVKSEQLAFFIDHRLFMIAKDHATYLVPGFLKIGKVYLSYIFQLIFFKFFSELLFIF